MGKKDYEKLDKQLRDTIDSGRVTLGIGSLVGNKGYEESEKNGKGKRKKKKSKK